MFQSVLILIFLDIFFYVPKRKEESGKGVGVLILIFLDIFFYSLADDVDMGFTHVVLILIFLDIFFYWNPLSILKLGTSRSLNPYFLGYLFLQVSVAGIRISEDRS